MKWSKWGILLSLLILIWAGTQYPDDRLHVIFCDVGQGDATLITKGDFQMLVDGGPSGSKVLVCLSKHMPFWDRTIEVVANTHPEQDHLGGLPEVLKRFQVERLLINGVTGETEAAKQIKEIIREKTIKVSLPRAGDRLRYSDLYIDILWPAEVQGDALAWTGPNQSEVVLGKSTNLNQESIVMMLSFGDFRALLTGDIGEKQELALGSSEVLTEVDVLKVAHHGSKTSSSEWLLNTIKPDESVVSVGAKNSYGHPTKVVLNRLDTLRSRVWRTDLHGTVEIVTGGVGYTIKADK